MENASKALIIAGAILLAILLISLGIMIFNQAQDTVNNSGMSQAEITAFNNKFLKYEGTRSGSEVKAMCNEVIASNADSSNANRIIGVYYNDDAIIYVGNPKNSTNDILTSKNYNVEMVYATSSATNKTKGCISQIKITDAN